MHMTSQGGLLSNEAEFARDGPLAVQEHLRALLAPGTREAARHERGAGATGRAVAARQRAAARLLEHQGVVATIREDGRHYSLQGISPDRRHRFSWR